MPRMRLRRVATTIAPDDFSIWDMRGGEGKYRTDYLTGGKNLAGSSGELFILVVENLEIGVGLDCVGQCEIVLKFWEISVALDLAVHECQIKVGTLGKRLLVKLRAAADKDVVRKVIGLNQMKRSEDADIVRARFGNPAEFKLVRPGHRSAAAPFPVLAENLGPRANEASWVSGENQCFAIWQGLLQTLERGASHDDDLA